MKKFIIKCNKCGSENVFIAATHDQNVSFICEDCDNACTEDENEE